MGESSTLSMESADQPRDTWLPRAFIARALNTERARFVGEHNHGFFLLVKIDQAAGELASGLNAATGTGAPGGPDGIGFATVRRSPDSVMALLSARRKLEERLADQGRVATIPSEFRSHPCFVCPLQKRSQEAFLDRITVGRARNHDIVLRHRSVSKFHGWFECTPDGRLFVGDAGSKNRTTVDGTPIDGRWEVTPGDPVRFGSVVTTLCTPETLWLVLHEED